ncbi:calcium-binding protein [Roseibium sp.]|uniref:calcium-binding protein n=1 Tax=Roseibium sp. TaxID=1936156 RepID=UPI003BB142AA
MQTFTPRPRGAGKPSDLLDPLPDKAELAELAQKIAEIDAAEREQNTADVALLQSEDANLRENLILERWAGSSTKAPVAVSSRGRLLRGVAQTVLIANVAIALALVLEGFTGQLAELAVETADGPEGADSLVATAEAPDQQETFLSSAEDAAESQDVGEPVEDMGSLEDLFPDDVLIAQGSSVGSGGGVPSADLLDDPFLPDLLAYLLDPGAVEDFFPVADRLDAATETDPAVSEEGASGEAGRHAVHLAGLENDENGTSGRDADQEIAGQLEEGSPEILQGGVGTQTLIGSQGIDTIDGDSGEDWVTYANSAQAAHIDLNDDTPGSSGDAGETRRTNIKNVVGSGFSDVIKGDDRNNILVGLGGNDTLSGGAGDDWLKGNRGADTLNGGSGADRLNGGRGNDTISGGGDNDLIHGGQGQDDVRGGTGNDRLYAGQGYDTLHGNGGNDVLYGGKNADSLFGGAGNDRLYGEYGRDTLHGGDGSDVLYGGRDRDKLYGDSGDDSLYGEYGNDLLIGGLGNDKLYGGRDQDRLFGGVGDDLLKGEAGRDTLYGGFGTDRLFGGSQADRLYGEAGNDRLDGGGGQDKLFGGEGNDRLFGRNGDDQLAGGAGNDWLEGGWGQDTFIFREGFGTDTITDFRSGWDRLRFSDYDGIGFEDLDLQATDFGVILSLYEDTVFLSELTLEQLSETDFLFT